MISYNTRYNDCEGVVEWTGTEVVTDNDFETFLQSEVKERFDAEEAEEDFENVLQDVATSVWESENVEQHLESYELPTDDRTWKIGEAVAECLLIDRESLILPWNRSLDETKSKVSLPGTDILAFVKIDGATRFLFGEVKTSGADSSIPVSAMYSLRDQMRDHLVKEARNPIHNSILRYLRPRVKLHPEYWQSFKAALRQYMSSERTAIVVSGMLLRDTSPTERDVKSPARSLVHNAEKPTEVWVDAYYLPIAIQEWPEKMREASS